MAVSNFNRVKRIIFGDILTSPNINEALKKWRRQFGVSQVDLAKWMGIASSVISEYEKDRRRSPGTRFLRKFVQALIDIDMKRGGKTIALLLSNPDEFISEEDRKAIILIQDFTYPFDASLLIDSVDGEILAGESLVKFSKLYGYTVLDSLATIMSLSGESFYRIFGRSTERAIIFTNVSTGRSPMVAVRVYPFKPRLVVIHKPKKVDPLSVRLAEKEHIIYVLSRLETEDELIFRLRKLSENILSGKVI
jgi:putative transcriptional regulator